MNWNKISDSALISEYNNRFKLKTGDKIADAKEASLHLTTALEERDIEQFIVIYLNTANKIIDTEILFKGTITTSNVYPGKLLRKYLIMKHLQLYLGIIIPVAILNQVKMIFV